MMKHLCKSVGQTINVKCPDLDDTVPEWSTESFRFPLLLSLFNHLQVMDQMQSLEMEPNDRTLHIVQRAGEMLRQQKMEDNGDTYSWNTVLNKMSVPRTKIGF